MLSCEPNRKHSAAESTLFGLPACARSDKVWRESAQHTLTHWNANARCNISSEASRFPFGLSLHSERTRLSSSAGMRPSAGNGAAKASLRLSTSWASHTSVGSPGPAVTSSCVAWLWPSVCEPRCKPLKRTYCDTCTAIRPTLGAGCSGWFAATSTITRYLAITIGLLRFALRWSISGCGCFGAVVSDTGWTGRVLRGTPNAGFRIPASFIPLRMCASLPHTQGRSRMP